MTTLPRRLLATASLAATLAAGGLALSTATASAAPTAPTSASRDAGSGAVLAATDTNSDSHAGRWGLAGLTGMAGLFGYKKYTDHRAARGGTQRVGGVDDDLGGSTRL